MSGSDKDRPDDDVMNTLGSSVKGVQDYVGSVYATLEKSLQRNVQMSQGMMSMIEQVYRANVKIASSLKPAGNGKVRLRLTVSNRTQFPAAELTGAIEFETTEKIDISYSSAYQNKDASQALPNLFETPCNLAPQTQYTQDIDIGMAKPVHCNGLIVLTVLNPMNNKPFQLRHSFGLYLIDQFKKLIVEKNESDLELVGTLPIPTAFLREIMEIHPIKGINLGLCIGLSSLNCTLLCEITSISKDHNEVEIQVSSSSKQLASNLIVELNKLKR